MNHHQGLSFEPTSQINSTTGLSKSTRHRYHTTPFGLFKHMYDWLLFRSKVSFKLEVGTFRSSWKHVTCGCSEWIHAVMSWNIKPR